LPFNARSRLSRSTSTPGGQPTSFNIYKNVNIPVGVYNWTRHQFTYGTPQDRRLTVRVFERFGSYYNGKLNEFRVRAGYRANEHLSFSVGPQWNRFRLPLANGDFSVLFGALETDYAFSRFLSLSTILQVDTANAQAANANAFLCLSSTRLSIRSRPRLSLARYFYQSRLLGLA